MWGLMSSSIIFMASHGQREIWILLRNTWVHVLITAASKGRKGERNASWKWGHQDPWKYSDWFEKGKKKWFLLSDTHFGFIFSFLPFDVISFLTLYHFYLSVFLFLCLFCFFFLLILCLLFSFFLYSPPFIYLTSFSLPSSFFFLFTLPNILYFFCSSVNLSLSFFLSISPFLHHSLSLSLFFISRLLSYTFFIFFYLFYRIQYTVISFSAAFVFLCCSISIFHSSFILWVFLYFLLLFLLHHFFFFLYLKKSFSHFLHYLSTSFFFFPR